MGLCLAASTSISAIVGVGGGDGKRLVVVKHSNCSSNGECDCKPDTECNKFWVCCYYGYDSVL